jgi:threonine dehydrogenase-like Zn-dependent dehydrogenase
MSRMRAAVITAPRRCEVVEVALPKPAREQVLIEIEGCGVCGSNLSRWEGRPWFTYPADPGNPGHEGWGTVVEKGDDVRDVAVGDRVAFLSERAFAEYDVSSAYAKLPIAGEVPGEPLGCAMNIFGRTDVRAGQTVAVIGLGFLGALVTQLAARAAARVIAISQRPWSLALAKRMGATETIELSHDDAEIVARVDELTGGHGCERVIEVVGMQRPLDLATKLARVRGRLVIAGFHQDGPRTIDMFQWNWRGLDVVNAHERDPREYLAGMAAAIEAIATHQLDPKPLYTHRVPLAEAGAAFELLRTRPDGFVKALVMP